MANVRRDANGIPKAAVFEHHSTVAHRTAVNAVDATDPASTDSAINADGWEVVDFDIEATIGGTDPVIEVAPIYWNSVAELWFKGESEFLTETGKYRLRCEARGAITFLKVIAIDGDTPTLSMNVWASLS